MDRKIIIQISLNTRSKGGESTSRFDKELNKTWIENRLRIFRQYTLQSLKAQTNQDFLVLINCHDETLNIINEFLNGFEKLPENIKIVGTTKFKEEVKNAITGFKYLYLVRLDSDDMYHKDFVNLISNYNNLIGTEALMNKNGYVYNHNTKELAKWEFFSPPFYTLIYDVDNYLKGQRYYLERGHCGIRLLKYEILPGENYMIIVHKDNMTTTWEYEARKSLILDNKDKILKEFGL